MLVSRGWIRTRVCWPAAVCAAILVGAAGRPARAHTRMDMPPARDMQDGYKPTRTPGFVLPCGIARSAAQPVTSLVAGSTIGMKWTETVYHLGCFIIDFASADTGPSTVFQRLQIAPHAPGTGEGVAYQAQVKLPAQPCTNCILRIRQYMLGSNPCPPANLRDNDANLYYSCANVVLTAGSGAGGGDGGAADAAVDTPAVPEMDAAAVGSSGTGGGSGGTIGSSGGASAGSGGDSGRGSTSGTGGARTDLGNTDVGSGCSVADAPAAPLAFVLAAALAIVVAFRCRRRV
ncbi:MAG TPA: MYXO-CTERM sorting domain-containing protein [Polyangia bacterium]|nr:MYXO-CTERM sorting domain-containing protein [Polyangia bacterium]